MPEVAAILARLDAIMRELAELVIEISTGGHTGPPPSDTRSRRCGPRQSQFPAGRGGSQPRDARRGRPTPCRETQSPASEASKKCPENVGLRNSVERLVKQKKAPS